MQSLFIIGLSVLVFVHSLSRFRNLAVSHDTRDIPGPAGAFTTSLNYWGGAVIYGGIFVLGYVALLLILKTRTLRNLPSASSRWGLAPTSSAS